jgi:hypothetical protein
VAWSAPLTALAGVTLTAAQWNTHVRDNLLATEIGLATPADGSFNIANKDDNELTFLKPNVSTDGVDDLQPVREPRRLDPDTHVDDGAVSDGRDLLLD